MRERKKSGIIKAIKKLYRKLKNRIGKNGVIIGSVVLLVLIIAVVGICLSRCSQDSGTGDPMTGETDVKQTLSPITSADNTSADTAPVTEYISPIDFDALRAENSEDVVGYLEIPGTTVSYPVMCHPTNNEYYLTRTPDGKYDAGGSLFMEKENSTKFTDPVTLIYGHNMNGNTNCERPYFAFFQNEYSKQEYLDGHSTVNLYLPDRLVKYKVCAAVPYDAWHILYGSDYTEQDQFDALMDKIYSQSGKSYACFSDREKPSGDSGVLILSTCYMWNNDMRYLLVCEEMTAEEIAAETVDTTDATDTAN